jgi:ATP-dependent RNA helicase DeaD
MHSARVPSQDEILQAVRRAGYQALTPLQSRLIPLLLRGRDVAVEVPPGSGATTAVVVPLALGLRGAGPAPHAVILVPGAEDVAKIGRAWARFSRVVRDAPFFVPLGEIEDARREQRRLEKGATVVAGTPLRVIDHIRRSSLGFGKLATFVMREPAPEARADFIKDVQFIFAKFTQRPQVVLLSRSPLDESNELLTHLHHPVLLPAEDKAAAAPAAGEHCAFPLGAAPRADVLARMLLGLRLPPTVVFHLPRTDARRIVEALRGHGLRAASLPLPAGVGRQSAEQRIAAVAFSRRSLDALLLPLGTATLPPDLEQLSPAHVIYYEPPGVGIRGGIPAFVKRARLFAVVEPGRERDFTRLQEALGVAFNQGEIPNDEAVLTGAIDRAVQRMKAEDPSELARLRSQIRRQVPLLQRPLFMAALLKAQLPPLGEQGAKKQHVPQAPARAAESPAAVPPRGQRGRFGRNLEEPGSRLQRHAESARQPRPPEGLRQPRVEARKPGEFAQLFVSIGRNRRVYARDLTQLFTEKLQLLEGDIGGVRVFEKYSFVDIVPARAEDAIARLTGTELKGRAITVNYAKKKGEKQDT